MDEKPKSRVCADGRVRGNGRTKLAPKKCLIPDCERMFGDPDAPGGRGLCKSCHGYAAQMVRKGKITWSQLEALGLAEPKFSNLVERAIELRRREIEQRREEC